MPGSAPSLDFLAQIHTFSHSSHSVLSQRARDSAADCGHVGEGGWGGPPPGLASAGSAVAEREGWRPKQRPAPPRLRRPDLGAGRV